MTKQAWIVLVQFIALVASAFGLLSTWERVNEDSRILERERTAHLIDRKTTSQLRGFLFERDNQLQSSITNDCVWLDDYERCTAFRGTALVSFTCNPESCHFDCGK